MISIKEFISEQTILSDMTFDLWGVGQKIENVKNSIESTKDSMDKIAQFCAQVLWVAQHPYESFRLVMIGVANLAEYFTIFICGVAVLMAIFGNTDWLKHIPKSVILYVMLRIFVGLL